MLAELQEHLNRHAPDTLLAEGAPQFYAFYEKIIRQLVRGHPLGGDDDLTQAVWLRVLRHIPELEKRRDQPGLRRWLERVVYSCWVDALRERRKHPAQSLDQVRQCGQEPVASDGDPVEACAREWRREALHAALAELRPTISDTDYHILHAHWFEGLAHAEIGARLGLAEPEVRYLHSRAFLKLRTRLEVYFGKNGEDM